MLRRSDLQRPVRAGLISSPAAPSAVGAARTRRAAPIAAASSVPGADPSRSILEAFYYGKAFATVLNKKLGDLAVGVLGDVSRAATELPQQLQAFQDEVQDMVREELGAAEGGAGGADAPKAPSGGGGLPTGGAGDGIKGYNTAPTDLQAVVDELRADIAASRAVLQQLKSQP